MDVKLIVSVLLIVGVQMCLCEEPHCTKFSFLEQLLEKLIRMEIRMDSMQEQLKFQQSAVLEPTVHAQSPSPSIAFCATATNRQSNLPTNQIIQFDNVLTNVGQSYDKSKGTFTAPIDGTYWFQTTVLTDNNVEIWGYITVNGESKVRFNARATDGRHDSGSQTLIISLKKGDAVTVRNGHHQIMNIYGGQYTTFAGYLLF